MVIRTSFSPNLIPVRGTAGDKRKRLAEEKIEIERAIDANMPEKTISREEDVKKNHLIAVTAASDVDKPEKKRRFGESPAVLQRLAHVFDVVLVLPAKEEEVVVLETPESFLFLAHTKGGRFGAYPMCIKPGMKRIEVRREDDADSGDDDCWEVRLPSSTIPMMTTAKSVDGRLLVIVPKKN